jgi:hypothetical protein
LRVLLQARKEVVFALSPILRERTSWDINKRWIVRNRHSN